MNRRNESDISKKTLKPAEEEIIKQKIRADEQLIPLLEYIFIIIV